MTQTKIPLAMLSTLVACTKPNPEVCCLTADSCQAIGLQEFRFCADDLVCVDNTCAEPTCPAGMSCPTSFELSVIIGGTGAGTVDSMPGGMSCSSGTCKASFALGAEVKLRASPANSSFLGWSDDCSGTGACSVVMDRDRTVGALFSIPGQALWVDQLGGIDDDLARAVVADSAGNLVVVGEFRASFVTGGTTLTSAGAKDVFVVKLVADTGAVVWAKRFGGAGDDMQPVVTVDASNNIYVAGTFEGPANFGGATLPGGGSADGFLLKLDPGGTHVWSKQIGGAGFDQARTIATRGNSVVVAGSFQQSLTVNGATLTSASGDDGFVAQFTVDGGAGWAKSFGGTGGDVPNALAIDAADNVVVTGRFSGTSNFGNGGMASSGFEDIFIVKYNGSSGALLFVKTLGGTAGDIPYALATDASNSIVIAGMFSGTVNFGAVPVSGNTNNMFIAKYTVAGGYQWARGIGDTATLLPTGLAIDATGNATVSGQFCGTFSIDGKMLSSVNSCASDKDVYVLRLSGTDGAHLNSQRAGGTRLDVTWGMAQSSNGRNFVVGGFQGFSEFGGQGFTSAGGYDAFVLALAPL